MNKNILICVGITILFLGVSIQPAIAVNPISSDNEEDCSICPKVSKLQVVEKYQEISERITILKEMNKEIIPDKQIMGNEMSTICDILSFHLVSLILRDIVFTNLGEDLENSNPILSLISYSIAGMYFIRLLIVGAIYSIFGCWEEWDDPWSIL